MTVRVRFAPAPTGHLHVGGARTALFNWLFARHHGGKFVLRVEDTDPERSKEEFLDSIFKALEWLGMNWDEGPHKGGDYGPYVQSARDDIYREHLVRLVDGGYTYDCYCTPEELEAQREKARAEKRAYRYDERCARLIAEDVAAYEAEGRRPSVRFRMPREGVLFFDDVIRGKVEVPAEEYDDFIIARPDGTPTYNFVCAVDDATMAITHVIRGEDHITNTPKQLEVLRVLGYDAPAYAHLPLLLGPDKSRLSKRHGAASVLEYQEQGFLPEAFVNFLALLGWSYDDAREYFTRDELIKYFSLERVKKSGAVFDVEKLTWMNGTYIRELSKEELFYRTIWYILDDLRTSDILNVKKFLPDYSNSGLQDKDIAVITRYFTNIINESEETKSKLKSLIKGDRRISVSLFTSLHLAVNISFSDYFDNEESFYNMLGVADEHYGRLIQNFLNYDRGELLRNILDYYFIRALPYIAESIYVEKDKIKRLSEVPELIRFFFDEQYAYEEKAEKNVRKLEEPPEAFAELADRFDALETFNAEAIEGVVRDYAGELGVGGGKVIHAVRAALSGRSWGPSLFEMAELLGRERCVRRLRAAAERFGE